MAAELAAGFFSEVVAFTKENQSLVVPVVFLVALAESLVILSIFVPSSILFLAIGAAYSAAGGSFWEIWVAAAAGAVLGDVVSFAAGRYWKSGLRRVWPFSSYPALMARGRVMFARHGMLTIITSKFLGNLRPLMPTVAGAMRMRWAVFLPASVISSFIWAGVFLAPGFGIFKPV